MKKVLALVICIAMIACVAVTASAATAATFTIATVDAPAVGEVVTIDMTIAEAKTMIGAIGFTFDYDDEYLKFVEHPELFDYFIPGTASGGATAAGNEESMEVQLATAGGFKAVGTVMTLAFEVIKEIPAGEVAEVTAEITLAPEHAEDNTVQYDVKVVAGGVAGPKAEEPPVVEGPEVPAETKDVVTDTNNPDTGDATGIAVAAGLCAVMAAAFVITKKVND